MSSQSQQPERSEVYRLLLIFSFVCLSAGVVTTTLALALLISKLNLQVAGLAFGVGLGLFFQGVVLFLVMQEHKARSWWKPLAVSLILPMAGYWSFAIWPWTLYVVVKLLLLIYIGDLIVQRQRKKKQNQ